MSDIDLGIQIIQLYYLGYGLNNGSVINVGSVAQYSTQSLTIVITNIGANPSSLFLTKSGITAEGSGSIGTNPVQNSGLTLTIPGNPSTSFTVNLDTNSAGNKSIIVTVISNDTDNNVYLFTINFSVTSTDIPLPIISLLYQTVSYVNGGSIDLGSFPLNGTNTITLEILNTGPGNLVIPQNGITLGDGSGLTISDNPVLSNYISIPINTSRNFTITLDSSALFTKTFTVNIASNDVSKNPYILTLTYNTSNAYQLVVEEESNAVVDGQNVGLGFFVQKSPIVKNITMSNSGVFYNIRVLGITAEDDVVLQNIPSLPLILQINQTNVVQFTAIFSSETLGVKTAGIKIQWEVAS